MLLIGSVGSGFSLILTVLHWPVMQHRDVDAALLHFTWKSCFLFSVYHAGGKISTSYGSGSSFCPHDQKPIKLLSPLDSRVASLSTSPLQSLAGFTVHRRQLRRASDSPGYLWTRFNSSWDVEPPASGGASQWEDFLSGEKQIILTQSSHFASLFLRRLWS